MVFSEYKKQAKFQLYDSKIVLCYFIFCIFYGLAVVGKTALFENPPDFFYYLGSGLDILSAIIDRILYWFATTFACGIIFARLKFGGKKLKLNGAFFKKILIGCLVIYILENISAYAYLWAIREMRGSLLVLVPALLYFVISILLSLIFLFNTISAFRETVTGKPTGLIQTAVDVIRNLGNIILFELTFTGWVLFALGALVLIIRLLEPLNYIATAFLMITQGGVALYLVPYFLLSNLNFADTFLAPIEAPQAPMLTESTQPQEEQLPVEIGE